MSAQAEIENRVEYIPCFEPALHPAPYKVLFGGRGRGASWFAARWFLIELTAWDPLAEGKGLLLCTREYQASIKESVYQLLKNQIGALKLPGWKILDNELRCVNGSRVIFAGLRKDIDAIKSYEGVNRVWVEEAETVSENSLTTLLPTIRAEGSEVWFTFNPKKPDAPVFKRMVENPPPGAVVVKSTYRDNPYFPKILQAQMEWDRKVNPEMARHVWDGEFLVITDAQIFGGKYSEDDNWQPGEDWNGPFFGADWGDVHPTCLVKCWIHGKRLYIDDEAGGSGIELDDIGPVFKTVEGADSHVIRADPSLPATIRHVCKSGLNVVPAKKGPGSVEDGIKFMKNFEMIVVRPRCKHTIEELERYSYKVDRLSGDVLPIIIDAYNHRIDSIRYALEPIMQKRPSWGVS